MTNAAPFDWAAFRRGIRASVCTGGFVLSASFIGFGALLRANGLSIPEGLVMTVSIWALPGQVVLVTMLHSGAGIAAIALAVTLTAVRLMPMVVTLLAQMRVADRPFWLHLLAGHFTTATVWIEARRAFPTTARAARLPYMLGLAATFVPIMLAMTVVGYAAADILPSLLAACLIFLTPAYFLTGLLAGGRDSIDGLSMVFGGGLLVVCHFLVPEIDMMVAGVAGGTLAYGVSRAIQLVRRHD